MDCRQLVRLIPDLDRKTALALRIVTLLPELYRELPFDSRQTAAIADVAVGAKPSNMRFCEAPRFELALSVARAVGLENIDVAGGCYGFSSERVDRLCRAALSRPGNTDILRLAKPTRAYWMLAIKSTPLLLCRLPGFVEGSMTHAADICKEAGTLAPYEFFSEDLRSDSLLAGHLLQLGATFQPPSHFNFLKHVLFAPTRAFTAAALEACADGLQYAALGSYTRQAAMRCVERNGMMLRFSVFKDLEVCSAAVGQNGLALRYCPEFRDELQFKALEQTPVAVRFADRDNPAVVHAAMPTFIQLFGVSELVTEHDLICAVRDEPDFVKYIPHEDHTPGIAQYATPRFLHPFFRPKRTNAKETPMEAFIRMNDVQCHYFEDYFCKIKSKLKLK
jgi:hypothetical protein